MKPLSSTYRLQLRQGVDFDRAVELLPHIAGLGVSHLYLSPIFTAEPGSTHGYDIADPTEIDPELGGREGFTRLSRTARHDYGILLVLDLVPNHTVLSPENPWLFDALRHGAKSHYAGYFDIDWSHGLILPILPDPFDDMVAAKAFTVNREEERLEWEGGWLPLAPGTASLDWDEMMRAQSWQLRFWERERRRLSHRRFFNVTTLIGMRIEEPQVFDAMMALPIQLVQEGLVHGLRIDHVDGLAQPGEYLGRLRKAVGDGVPIWVEKILTGDEDMPADWSTEGTTGYETSDRISRLLTAPEGRETLDAFWREATGVQGDYEALCVETRGLILDTDLGAELTEMTARAASALAERGERERDADALRGAIRALLCSFPQYRSYVTPDGARAEDEALLSQTFRGAEKLGCDDGALTALRGLFDGPEGPKTLAFVTRFQQVTGAVVAKAQEDTAFFRYTRNLAECEVGSEPDSPTLSPEDLNEWAQARLTRWPVAMNLGSSHDTKRAEDARARLVAITHHPEALRALWQHAAPLACTGAPPAHLRWYILQSALALWEPGREDLGDRLAAHLEKAMREARQLSTWTDPDEAAERQAAEFGRALLDSWETTRPQALQTLVEAGHRLSLVQFCLRCLLPGIPDIYQGTEFGSFALTDPDNRDPLDPEQALSDFGQEKLAKIRCLLRLRLRDPEFFMRADCTITEDGSEIELCRRLGTAWLKLRFRRDGGAIGGNSPVVVESDGLGAPSFKRMTV
ncbi:malto-oligosyltrehalose synthase [Salipiger pallidus]|uniref:Malto-oligosyltrehalose synthase n=1 Tax=Salipiger pallidus TaxID=1775170 RepID=A0A8J2ZLN2_9RHOB|nr:malto-oligosyltrehalose synthase [Salipiger pallidus]GGG79841.1 malto-oligosyltrehalose synthase [Salipiger pallidus]